MTSGSATCRRVRLRGPSAARSLPDWSAGSLPAPASSARSLDEARRDRAVQPSGARAPQRAFSAASGLKGRDQREQVFQRRRTRRFAKSIRRSNWKLPPPSRNSFVEGRCGSTWPAAVVPSLSVRIVQRVHSATEAKNGVRIHGGGEAGAGSVVRRRASGQLCGDARSVTAYDSDGNGGVRRNVKSDLRGLERHP